VAEPPIKIESQLRADAFLRARDNPDVDTPTVRAGRTQDPVAPSGPSDCLEATGPGAGCLNRGGDGGAKLLAGLRAPAGAQGGIGILAAPTAVLRSSAASMPPVADVVVPKGELDSPEAAAVAVGRDFQALRDLPVALQQHPRVLAAAARSAIDQSDAGALAEILSVYPQGRTDPELIRQAARHDGLLPLFSQDAARHIPEVVTAYQRFWDLGIEFPERFGGPEARNEIVANRLHAADPGDDTRPLAVVITAKHESQLGMLTRPSWQPLMQGYRVLAYEAATDDDVVRALRDATQDGAMKASVVVWAGDGWRSGMNLTGDAKSFFLDEAHFFDRTDVEQLTHAGFAGLLARDAHLVLVSCDTATRGQPWGIPPVGGLLKTPREWVTPTANLAEALHQAAPAAWVHAAQGGVVDAKFLFDREQRLQGVQYLGEDGLRVPDVILAPAADQATVQVAATPAANFFASLWMAVAGVLLLPFRLLSTLVESLTGRTPKVPPSAP